MTLMNKIYIAVLVLLVALSAYQYYRIDNLKDMNYKKGLNLI